MGMAQYRENVLEKREQQPKRPSLSELLIQIILFNIHMDREGDSIDKQLIMSAVSVLSSSYESTAEDESERLYLTRFEPRFLKASEAFYSQEGNSMLQDADAASYCRHVLNRIHEEYQRCRTMLVQSTTSKITDVLEAELISKNLRELILSKSGVRHMVDNDNFDDLKLLYTLNTRVDLRKEELTKALQRGIQEVGNQITDAATTATQPQVSAGDEQEGSSKQKSAAAGGNVTNLQTLAAFQWVQSILKLKEKYDLLWAKSLESDPIIQPALSRSLTEVINVFPRSSEFISLFIDDHMKRGLKDKSEAEVDQILDQAIILLRYLSDKDMFERYYKKHLCKRLLMNKSLSNDNEQEMIRKMKVELGNSFVLKLEAMFKDMAISEQLTSTYQTGIKSSDPSHQFPELSIHVLTLTTWPLETMQAPSITEQEPSARNKVIYPSAIDHVRQSFENFYISKHAGRKLTWLPHMGTADIRVTFPKIEGKEGVLGKDRRHELNVSTYAMVILLLFNEHASLTFDQIQSLTNISTSDLVRNLQSLAVAPKTRVLVKEPMSKDVKPTDVFTFNPRFTHPYTRLKIGVVAGSDRNRVEGDRERRETEKRNDVDRTYAAEAALVRIMKSRKELAHQQLIAEAMTQLATHFPPNVNKLKAAIENLIEREYFERVEGSNPPAYRYLA